MPSFSSFTMIVRLLLTFLIFACTYSVCIDRPSADYTAAVYEHFPRIALRPDISYRVALKIMNENLDVYEKQMAIAAHKVSKLQTDYQAVNSITN